MYDFERMKKELDTPKGKTLVAGAKARILQLLADSPSIEPAQLFGFSVEGLLIDTWEIQAVFDVMVESGEIKLQSCGAYSQHDRYIKA